MYPSTPNDNSQDNEQFRANRQQSPSAHPNGDNEDVALPPTMEDTTSDDERTHQHISSSIAIRTNTDSTAQNMIPLLLPQPPTSLLWMMSQPKRRLLPSDASPEERIEYGKGIIKEALDIIDGKYDQVLDFTNPQ
ncbi:unnamed protein product [Cylindrotheca closterium]|uniref:Uncharacterized protein n=1 Tax=Cylindrotheca closterium TaxID=2856 RepID=A0AAD2JJT3_9STRA|nr:unnamed protein product [Cylindrotheca closterium]